MLNKSVRFLKGTSTGFAAIAQKDDNTFYYLIDTKELYLGNNPIGSTTVLETIKEVVGSVEDLKTGNKSDLVSAINEVYDRLVLQEKASKVALEKDTSGLIYTLRQGEASESDPESNVVGVINIPQDMIVKNAEVVTDPVGYPAGQYIKLIFSTTDEGDKEVYINTSKMYDAYKVEADAAEVQLNISESNTISATIVRDSITLDMLSQEVKNKLETGGAAELEWGTF